MKKIICKKEYDTETATLIKAYSYGYYGDPAGYEEDSRRSVLPARGRRRELPLPHRGHPAAG